MIYTDIHLVDFIGVQVDFAFEFESLVAQGLNILAAFCAAEPLEGAEGAESEGEDDQEVCEEAGLHGVDGVRGAVYLFGVVRNVSASGKGCQRSVIGVWGVQEVSQRSRDTMLDR